MGRRGRTHAREWRAASGGQRDRMSRADDTEREPCRGRDERGSAETSECRPDDPGLLRRRRETKVYATAPTKQAGANPRALNVNVAVFWIVVIMKSASFRIGESLHRSEPGRQTSTVGTRCSPSVIET